MKRSRPLRRSRTPLPVCKPLERHVELARISAARRREQRERRRVVRDRYGPDPLCQAMVRGVCQVWADDGHEPRTRARGGDPCDPGQVIPICRACHGWVHTHPAQATAMGLLVPSWEGGAA